MAASLLACAAAYAALVALILLQARRSRTGLWLAAAAAATAAWAAAACVAPAWSGGLDLLHLLAWYGFCLHLYRRAAAPGAPVVTALLGFGAAAAVAIAWRGAADLAGPLALLSPTILLRLGLAICQLLLLENVWRRRPAGRGAAVGLACLALGGLAAYDAVVCADAVLMRAAAPALLAGRPLVAALVMPLLGLAAARNRAWQVDLHLSRAAAFHSATLIVSGVFLLALAAAGELARQLAGMSGPGWGSLAEICVVFAGVITLAAMLASATARAALRRGVVEHFFTHRFDYRRQWQRCIDTLTASGASPLQERVIRVLAEAVDSRAGLLFLPEPGQAGLAWAGAWNTTPLAAPPLEAPVQAAVLAADRAMQLPPVATAGGFTPWLAVPLPDRGIILLSRPPAGYRIDAEVLDLLRILAHEVAIHLAQARANATLLQTAELRAYGERFAFVAHDIKNVSSQLSLLLSNAETHLADPAFQADMLATVRAAVARIGGLIRRLQPTAAPDPPAPLDPAPVLAALVAQRSRGATRIALEIEPAAAGARVGIAAAALQAAVGHVLDNAVAAARDAGVVRVGLRAEAGLVVVEIADDGPGMTAEFIRDHLFAPFSTRTKGGTGLGAFQARTLVRAAGGEIAVASQPGAGTTMRLLFPDAAAAPTPASVPASGPASVPGRLPALAMP